MIPFDWPRMTTETLASGFSFSSTTLPETKANFFWENDNSDSKMQVAVSSILGQNTFISEYETRYELKFNRRDGEINRRDGKAQSYFLRGLCVSAINICFIDLGFS